MRHAILFFCFVASASAQLRLENPFFSAAILKGAAAGGGGGGGDSCTGCTNETFEGAGYVLTGWAEAGSVVNEDYTTGPAPIADSQSLLVKNVAFDTAYSEKNVNNVAEGWFRFAVISTNAVPTGLYVAAIADSGGAAQAIVSIQAGKLRITCGSATADTVTSIAANRTNYVWVHYSKGSGANAVADVGFAEHPTKTRPTSGNAFAQVTTGTSTANLQIIRCGGGDGAFGGAVGGLIFDTVSFTSAGAIGDFP